MARVTLVKQYSGTSLGFAWALVRPMLFIAVFWFAVSVGLRGSRLIGEAPYLLWLLPGIIAWFFVSETINGGGSSLRKNAHLVTRLVYPVATIPVFTVLAALFVHVVLMAIVVAIFLVTGYGIDLYFLQLPYYMLCAFAFGVVAATFFSALTAVSTDLGQLVRALMTLLFWLTPIIWPLESLDGLMKRIIMLNPITYIVQGYRNAFVLEKWFFQQWEYALYFWGFLIVFALLASFVFGKLRSDFADIL
jgi:ABC-type polysaccharide/polyol phosphate export permease